VFGLDLGRIEGLFEHKACLRGERHTGKGGRTDATSALWASRPPIIRQARRSAAGIRNLCNFRVPFKDESR
jgi:hypothetical protein